ncbi:hypothetical protein RR42_m1177 [Cupriavidus basilensis]|uniref:Uncharacterized protein n=1 Tax=Cupriavidus basilensis TaxID=68895 RepID=A0A0C4Y6P0_9BURK|nr:hypothetical protein RR42_m1177 [Cupriavidus basilensis]
MENEKEIEAEIDDAPDVEASPAGSSAPARAATPPVSVVRHSQEGASDGNVMERKVCHKPRRCGGMHGRRGRRAPSMPGARNARRRRRRGMRQPGATPPACPGAR